MQFTIFMYCKQHALQSITLLLLNARLLLLLNARKMQNYHILLNSKYFCISFGLVNKIITFTFLFLCRLQSYFNNLQ